MPEAAPFLVSSVVFRRGLRASVGFRPRRTRLEIHLVLKHFRPAGVDAILHIGKKNPDA